MEKWNSNFAVWHWYEQSIFKICSKKWFTPRYLNIVYWNENASLPLNNIFRLSHIYQNVTFMVGEMNQSVRVLILQSWGPRFKCTTFMWNNEQSYMWGIEAITFPELIEQSTYLKWWASGLVNVLISKQ